MSFQFWLYAHHNYCKPCNFLRFKYKKAAIQHSIGKYKIKFCRHHWVKFIDCKSINIWILLRLMWIYLKLWSKNIPNYLKNSFKLSIINLISNAKVTADKDLLKKVPVEILLNFGNYFRTFSNRNCVSWLQSTH